MGRKGHKEMEWAIVFGTLCTVTDCARQRIDRWILAAGLAVGAVMACGQMYRGKLGPYEVVLALLPGAVLWALSVMMEGKLGRGDGDMMIVLGLLLGWKLCLAVLCTACLLAGVFAGAGLAAGKLGKNSRLPFAPFLLAAMVLLRMISFGETGK